MYFGSALYCDYSKCTNLCDLYFMHFYETRNHQSFSTPKESTLVKQLLSLPYQMAKSLAMTKSL